MIFATSMSANHIGSGTTFPQRIGFGESRSHQPDANCPRVVAHWGGAPGSCWLLVIRSHTKVAIITFVSFPSLLPLPPTLTGHRCA